MDAVVEQTIRRRLEDKDVHRPAAGGHCGPADPHRPLHRSAFFELEKARVFAGRGCSPATSRSGPNRAPTGLSARSGAPIVVVRGDDGVLRAFYNACRHRGAPVTRDDCGTARRLTCQYHSWSYGTRRHAQVGPRRAELRRPRQAARSAWCPCAARPGTAGSSSSEDPTQSRWPTSSARWRPDGRDRRAGACGRWAPGPPPGLQLEADGRRLPRGVPRAHRAPRQRGAALQRPGHDGDDAAQRPQPPHRREARRVPGLPDGLATSTTTRRSRSCGARLDLLRHLPQPGGPDGHRAFTFLCMWPIGDRTTELELRWYTPAWEGEAVPQEHLDRMALFETVMARTRRTWRRSKPRSPPRGPPVPARLARAADPPLPAGGRPGDRPALARGHGGVQHVGSLRGSDLIRSGRARDERRCAP